MICIELVMCCFCLGSTSCYAENGILLFPYFDSDRGQLNTQVFSDELMVFDTEERIVEQQMKISLCDYSIKSFKSVYVNKMKVEGNKIDECDDKCLKKDSPKEETDKTEKKMVTNGIYPITFGSKQRMELSLTFDDGLDNKSVEKVLNTLKEKKIKSTFFVIGKALTKHAKLWQRAADEGHQICNHTNSHCFLGKLSEQEIINEIKGWENSAVSTLGQEYVDKMKKDFPYIRLPGGSGHKNSRVLETVASQGYIPIGWSAETCYAVLRHYKNKKSNIETISSKVCEHVVSRSQKGSIILLHFNPYDTQKLEEIISGIEQKGFKIKTVSDILVE